MADEANIPTHRWYQQQNHIKLPMQDVSESVIKAVGIAKIDQFMITTASNALFAAGEVGVWYDPSDLTTLFQDSAGTTPVTAAGQPVGRMLDKSGRGNHATQATAAQCPTYGIHPYSGVRNLQVQTENFSSASWTKNACAVSIPSTPAPARGGVYGRITSLGTFSGLKSPFVFTPLTQYTVSGVVKKASGSNFTLVGDSLTPPPKMELNFDTGAFSVANCTGAATLVGANEYFVTMTFTTPAVTTLGKIIWWVGVYSGISTAGQAFDLSAPQIELGATATAYQKVVTQYEVTEAGVPSVHYVGFDGVDDGMVTSAIDFSATSKMTVFTGLRKLSDAARGMVVELGAAPSTSSFQLNAPTSALTGYQFLSNGTVSAAATTALFPAPVTSVTTGFADISSDTVTLRVNGNQIDTSVADQGAGNYANAILYIGRRGGTSLPFNGNIYSLIIRGAQSTAGQITATETWVNGKTGAY